MKRAIVAVLIAVVPIITGILVAVRTDPNAPYGAVILGVLTAIIGLIGAFFYEIVLTRDSIKKEAGDIKKHIDDAVGVNIHPLLEPFRGTVLNLLDPSASGVEFVKRSVLLRHAKASIDQGYYRWSFYESEEDMRISVLSLAIKEAKRLVGACTYANQEHLTRFWNNPMIDEYYESHGRALETNANNGLILRRIFIVPDEFDANAVSDLLRVITRLREAGMKELRWIREDLARKLCVKKHSSPTKSFLFVDDEFFSVGRELNEEPAHVTFTNRPNELHPVREQFELLWGRASPIPPSRSISTADSAKRLFYGEEV